MSDALIITIDSKMEDYQIGLELTSMISCIVQQCSKKIFHVCLMTKENFFDFEKKKFFF
jgi:hypothetical protein